MILRHQRRCISCIYAIDYVDKYEGMDWMGKPLGPVWQVKCWVNPEAQWMEPHRFCNQGQWEWVDDLGGTIKYRYGDIPNYRKATRRIRRERERAERAAKREAKKQEKLNEDLA